MCRLHLVVQSFSQYRLPGVNFFFLVMLFYVIKTSFPLPSPVDHVLSELSTMTQLSWVALHNMAHSFIELLKAVIHVIILVSFL